MGTAAEDDDAPAACLADDDCATRFTRKHIPGDEGPEGAPTAEPTKQQMGLADHWLTTWVKVTEPLHSRDYDTMGCVPLSQKSSQQNHQLR